MPTTGTSWNDAARAGTLPRVSRSARPTDVRERRLGGRDHRRGRRHDQRAGPPLATRRTVIAVSLSLQRAHHGEQPYWAAIALAAMSGSMGRPGGGFGMGYGTGIPSGSGRFAGSDIGSLPQARIPSASPYRSRASPTSWSARDTRSITTVAVLPSPISASCTGAAAIRFTTIRISSARRCLAASGDGRRPRDVVDAAARFADVVLPVATSSSARTSPRGPTMSGSPRCTRRSPPPGDARTDYQSSAGWPITSGSARPSRRLVAPGRGYASSMSARADVSRELPPFDLLGAGRCRPAGVDDGIAGDFARLRADARAHPIATPSGRIELVSPRPWPASAMTTAPATRYGWNPSSGLAGQAPSGFPSRWSPTSRKPPAQPVRQRRTSQAAKVCEREPLLLNPADAAARDIGDGDIVRVPTTAARAWPARSSRRGSQRA